MATTDLTGGAVDVTTAISDNMVHGTQYAHYLRDSLSKPAPNYYGHLVSFATRKITIWDPYFHDVDTSIFESITHTVDVYVLSSKSISSKESYLNSLIAQTGNNIDDSVKGTCQFYFGFIDKSRHQDGMWNTHDRFLIVDDRYFLIGASIAHHLAPHDSTGICELTEQNDKDIVQNAFDQCWNVCVSDNMFQTVTI